MNESTTFKLNIPNINIDQLKADPQLIIARMTTQQTADLQGFLLDTLADKDGAPSIDALHIKQINFDNLSEVQGKFRISFTIDRRFCCSDTDSCQQDYIDFNFQIINNNLNAHATYFNWSLNN